MIKFYSYKEDRYLVNMISMDGKKAPALWFDVRTGRYYKEFSSTKPVLILDQRIEELGRLVQMQKVQKVSLCS